MASVKSRRRQWLAVWVGLAAVHAIVVFAMWLANRANIAEWLRDPFGVVTVLSMYGPIALATKLGAERATFERAAWLFGEITPAGWVLVIASWLLVHALIAALWVAWRRRGKHRSGSDT